MDVFTQIFSFLWSLLNDLSVTIGSYYFSLGGAIVFAVVVIVFICFLRWLFSGD